MTTELQLNQEQSAILQQKREGWAQMGEIVYRSELGLQLAAQKALNDIVLPSTIEEVPEAEELLKSLKSAATTISTDRKKVTSQFDAVTARLMEPEKSFVDPIKQLSDAIIAVKKEEEAKQAKIRLRNDEIRRCYDHFTNEKIRIESDLSTKVNSLVARCYEHALNSDMKPEAIGEYLTKSKASITVAQFPAAPSRFNHSILTAEEVDAIMKDKFSVDQQSFILAFSSGVDAKFSDYAIAYANKEQALKLAKEEEDRKAKEIAAIAANQTMANKIESAAQETVAVPSLTKALKKSYEVDMPETVESFLVIMAAFSANINLCMPKLKVTKWFGFTANQAAAALGKVKSDDNNFQPAGITFKEVSKL